MGINRYILGAFLILGGVLLLAQSTTNLLYYLVVYLGIVCLLYPNESWRDKQQQSSKKDRE